MPDKPHKPEPLTAHDPYPRPPTERDPMAERRAGSAAFHDKVAAAIAAEPKAPTHVTRTEGTPEAGYTITHDDGYGTVIKVEPGEHVGTFVLEVTSLGDRVRVQAGTGLAAILTATIGRVTDAARVAPIKGHR